MKSWCKSVDAHDSIFKNFVHNYHASHKIIIFSCEIVKKNLRHILPNAVMTVQYTNVYSPILQQAHTFKTDTLLSRRLSQQ